jgi:DNA-binding NarL/FixJ family response regulator
MEGPGVISSDSCRRESTACQQCVCGRLSPLQRELISVGLWEPLAPRQRELLRWMALGTPNKVIAHEMHTTPGTIKVYSSKLFDKLGVPNKAALAVWASQHPLLLSD